MITRRDECACCVENFYCITYRGDATILGSIFDPDTNFLSPTQILGIAIRPGARFSGSIFRFAVININLIARFWEAMFDGPNLDF